MTVMPMMRRLGPSAVPGNPVLAQGHCHRHREREKQREHREPAGDRTVRAGGEEALVADVLVEPAQARADGRLEIAGLQFADQRLVTEDQDDRHRARRQDRGQQSEVSESRSMGGHNGFQRTDGDEQGPDGRDAGRPGEQCQRADDDRDRHRKQPAGGHPALDRAPGQQNAQRDDGLGTQAVVQRQPEGQEEARRRPRRGLAGLDGLAEPRQHLAADHPPARQGHHQRGQPHPYAAGADVRPKGEQVVVPAERGLWSAEPSVVVGHVPGVFGHSGHGQDVAVVGCVGADEVPPHQHRGDHTVQRSQRPPARRQEAFDPPAVGGVQQMECAERDEGHRHADDHRQQFEQRRRTAVAGVQRRGERQARRCRTGEIGEDADDLRAEVVPPAFATQRFPGVVGRVVGGSLHQADEFTRHLVGLGGEREPLARRAEDLVQRCADDGGVTDDDEQVVVDPLDE